MSSLVGSIGRDRVAWPDFAKGVCVILVVAMHLYELNYITWFPDAPGARAWDAVVSAAKPIRMPLFFLISGYLAAGALWRPWGLVARNRVWAVAYLYVLWLSIYIFSYYIRYIVTGAPFILTVELWQVVWPQSQLWYLYAMVVFFVFARLTRRVPIAAIVVASAVASIVATTALEGTGQSLLRCLVFFIVGIRSPELVDFVVRQSSWFKTVLAGISYGLLCALIVVSGGLDFGLLLLAGCVGVFFALMGSVLAAHHRLFRGIRWLGRNTLAIFVLHPLIATGLDILYVSFPTIPDYLKRSEIIMALYPALLVVIVLAVCCTSELLLKRFGCGFLFHLPRSAKNGFPRMSSPDATRIAVREPE